MTTFLDGPAAGKTLMLRRTAHFLRVVINPAGEVDALDQLDDKPAPDETLYVYRISANHGIYHIYKRGGGSGWYNRCDYRLHRVQPTQERLRDPVHWAEFCNEQNPDK